MKIKRESLATFFVLILSMAGCVSAPERFNADEYKTQIDAINRVARRPNMFIVIVPSPGNGVANAMMSGILGVMNSNAIESLESLLNLKSDLAIGVVGHSSLVTVATVKAAIEKVTQNTSSKHIFLYVETEEAIKLNASSNIKVTVIGKKAGQ
ncbi:hypothetical protein [Herbaspirillum lusitanum]|uniref:hypothetical protein n=1 Tax=Herbaspirillum lusitanum TaxID=213312 RepID=UPI0012F4D71B|nr:hypothetical protein [Herbaspirillum lusitanum]